MSRPSLVVAHYGELVLKGANRRDFEERVRGQVARVLGPLATRVRRTQGRLLIDLAPEADTDQVAARLALIHGLVGFAFACPVPLDLEAMTAAALASAAARAPDVRTFAIRTRRADKRFAMTSVAINRHVGAAVNAATGLGVDLDAPDLLIGIEVLADQALVTGRSHPGAGGLPNGSAGRVVVLLSGGIDSPVAAARMMRRGCRVRFVHFHSAPFTDAASQEKARELALVLTARQGESFLHQVAFAGVQEEIIARAPPRYRVLVYRRFMVRIAERLAAKHRALALVTGESLGQVASQTLENLRAIESVATLPILRPLVAMDKVEIIAEARRLGTFELSTQPHQDCCSFMMPPSVATRARLADLDAAEAELEVDALVTRALEATTVEHLVAWT